LDFAGTQNYGEDNTAYAKYVESTTSNGLIKALAYTTANTNNYDYAIVDAYGYRNGDDVNKGLTFVGDDNEYELDATPDTAAVKSAAGAFVAYTKSGDTVTIAISIAKENGLATLSDEVSGVNNGQISFTNGITVKANKKNATDLTKTNVITDSNTLVYVIDSETGKYTESTMDAVSKNAHVYVPVIDSDGYADVILVDEYHDYTK
jgi:hypothetical protein